MMVLKLLLLAGLLAAFYPYGPNADSNGNNAKRKERVAYLVLSSIGFGLGVLHQVGVFPTLAGWMDQMMDVLSYTLGGQSS